MDLPNAEVLQHPTFYDLTANYYRTIRIIVTVKKQPICAIKNTALSILQRSSNFRQKNNMVFRYQVKHSLRKTKSYGFYAEPFDTRMSKL